MELKREESCATSSAHLVDGGHKLVLDANGQRIGVLHFARRSTNSNFARALFDVERLLLDGVALDAQPLARGTQALAFLADRLGSCSKSYIFSLWEGCVTYAASTCGANWNFGSELQTCSWRSSRHPYLKPHCRPPEKRACVQCPLPASP